MSHLCKRGGVAGLTSSERLLILSANGRVTRCPASSSDMSTMSVLCCTTSIVFVGMCRKRQLRGLTRLTTTMLLNLKQRM